MEKILSVFNLVNNSLVDNNTENVDKLMDTNGPMLRNEQTRLLISLLNDP